MYVGNMSGGKTAKMISDLQRAEIAGRRVQAFRLAWDNRYEEGLIEANNGQMSYPAEVVPGYGGLVSRLKKDTEVLAIDELQFWDDRMIDFIKNKRDHLRIIGTGLQHDFRGDEFALRSQEDINVDSEYHIGNLMALTTIGVKTYWPLCTHEEDGEFCSRPAPYVQRYNADRTLSLVSEPTLAVGFPVKTLDGAEKHFENGHCAYMVRCPEHYIKP